MALKGAELFSNRHWLRTIRYSLYISRGEEQQGHAVSNCIPIIAANRLAMNKDKHSTGKASLAMNGAI